MSRRFARYWLTAVGLGLAAFGLVMATASTTAIFRAVFGPLVEHAFWSGAVPGEAGPFRAWVYGTWGGTISGFGLLIAVTAKRATSDDASLRLGLLAAVTLWFLVDTGASVAFGVWGNALAVNVPVYLALTIPLVWRSRRPE